MLLLGLLCVWRLTHLLQAEDGPFDLITRLRRMAGEGFFGKLLDCFYCLSLWIAAPFAFLLGREPVEQWLLWPALSAGAIFLERVLPEDKQAPPAFYFEHEESDDGMLRTAETAGSPRGLD